MPVSDDERRKPSWVPYQEGATMSRDDNERWQKFDMDTRSYREGQFILPGYNPNHNSTVVESVNINNDGITFKPN